MTDLDELILKCRTDNAKEYISDAVACYKAGAFKPCIAATWMALVYDIIDKVKELSLTGDKNAKTILDKFNTYREQIENGDQQGVDAALKFERDILDVAKNQLDIIDKIQYEDLMRLKNDRNRCSHPSFRNDDTPYRPSPELARLHMCNTVEYVLSVPPLQGRAALQQILDTIQSQYFPVNKKDICDQLNYSSLKSSTIYLKQSLVDALFFGCFEPERFPGKKPSHLLNILNSCYSLYPDVVRNRLIQQINKYYTKVEDNKFHILMCIIVKFEGNVWDSLVKPLKTKVKDFICKGNKLCVVDAFPEIINITDLKYIIKFFVGSLTVSDLQNIFQNKSYIICDSLFDRVIQLYIDSRTNWDKTNYIANKLLIPYADHMKELHIKNILDIIQKDPDNIKASHSFNGVARALYECSKRTGFPRIEIDNVLNSIEKNDAIVSDKEYEDMLPF